MTSLLRKAAWLALFIGGLAWMVGQGMVEVWQRDRFRELLLVVQEALQKYHVDQERYIPRRQLKGSELIAVLQDMDFLPAMPLNPWTGEFWKLDGEEPDYLVYETDANFETYALRILRPYGPVIMELDSEENPSLE